jgi:hypothetical protein
VVAAASNGGSAETGDVVLTADSGALSTLENGWSYLIESEGTSVDPDNGRQGTEVTISGSRLRGGGSNIAKVTLAGVDADISSESDDEVAVVAGAGNIGAGDVVVIANSGALTTFDDAWTYTEPGEISTVNPSSGQSGTLVSIAGSALHGGGTEIVAVSLAGIDAEIIFENDTLVEVVAGEKSNSETEIGAVSVTSDTGAVITLDDSWTYTVAGAILEVLPNSGQYGTRVLITGETLDGSGNAIVSVSLAGYEAEIVAANDTVVQIIAGEGSEEESVGDVVLTADTGAKVTSSDAWTYIIPGRILVVDPNQGQLGTNLVVSGVDVCGGGTEVVSVTLVGISATITNQRDCSLVAATAGEYGTNVQGDVVLVSDTGAIVTSSDGWTYVSAGTISSVIPAAGQGGSLVTVVGESIFGGGTTAASVTLSGVPATIVGANDNSSYLVVRANDGPAEGGSRTGDIVVVGNSGVETRSLASWSYSVIDSISPNTGQQGTLVTITGTNLLAGGEGIASVELAGVETLEVKSASQTSVLCAVTQLDVTDDLFGSVVLFVNNSDQVVTSEDGQGFTYKQQGVIGSVSPDQGQGGTVLTVSGERLLAHGTSVADVTLSGISVSAILSQDNSAIVVRAADSSDAQTGDIVITSNTGSIVVLSDGWKYVAPGEVDTVFPSSGQYGTRVTINGTSLLSGDTDVSDVTLNGISVLSVVSVSDEKIVVLAGESTDATDAGDVLITSAAGSNVTIANAFSYNDPGTISTVAPALGREGTRVTISGSRLQGLGCETGGGCGVATVSLAGRQAAIASFDSETVIVSASGGDEGIGDVVVVSESGAIITKAEG